MSLPNCSAGGGRGEFARRIGDHLAVDLDGALLDLSLRLAAGLGEPDVDQQLAQRQRRRGGQRPENRLGRAAALRELLLERLARAGRRRRVVVERDDVAKRWQASQPISVHELLDPLMQGHDSVEIRSDIELGGTEQKFNLLVGRVLQEAAGQEPQAILTLPILVGLDGEQRMSKSLGNYVGIAEPPAEQFGKLMSIPDARLRHYWELAAHAPDEELARLDAALAAGDNPMTWKKALAERGVALYHGAEAAPRARDSFEQQFSRRGRPPEAVLWTLPAGPPVPLRKLLVDVGLARSGGEAKRKIEEGAVEAGGSVVTDPAHDVVLEPGRPLALRLGRRWVQVTTGPDVTDPAASPAPLPLAPD
ncbi:MAG: tyrosine--tRNA ligase [Candidatus Eisenbacteria bacterium]